MFEAHTCLNTHTHTHTATQTNPEDRLQQVSAIHYAHIHLIRRREPHPT